MASLQGHLDQAALADTECRVPRRCCNTDDAVVIEHDVEEEGGRLVLEAPHLQVQKLGGLSSDAVSGSIGPATVVSP